MNIYVLLIMLVLLQYIFICTTKPKSKSRKNIFIILITIELVLIATLRNMSVGPDSKQYALGFIKYHGLNIKDFLTKIIPDYPYDWEPGYFYLSKFVGLFTKNYTILYFIVSLILYIPLGKMIKEYSSNVLLSYMLYFTLTLYPYSLGIYRQMIATTIITVSYKFIKENRLIPYLICMFAAFMFHNSAIIFAPMFFFYKYFDVIRKHYLICLLGSMSSMFFGRLLLKIVFVLFPGYSSYQTSIYGSSGGSGLQLLMYCMMGGLILYNLYYKKHEDYPFIRKLYILALPMAILVQSFGYYINVLARANTYLNIILIMLLPNELSIAFKNKKNLCISLCVVYIILAMIAFLKLSTNSYINPYKFFWE